MREARQQRRGYIPNPNPPLNFFYKNEPKPLVCSVLHSKVPKIDIDVLFIPEAYKVPLKRPKVLALPVQKEPEDAERRGIS